MYPFWIPFWVSHWPIRLPLYSRSNLEISSLRKCYEVEKRSRVYMDVHEHRIAEIVTFAALEIFKVERL